MSPTEVELRRTPEEVAAELRRAQRLRARTLFIQGRFFSEGMMRRTSRPI
jgi:hypothetical protein